MCKHFNAGNEVELQVVRVLSNYFSMGGRNIEGGLRLVEDLYIDSMSLVEIVMTLNEIFSVELPAEGVGACRTVKDICDLVKKAGYGEGGDLGVNESRM